MIAGGSTPSAESGEGGGFGVRRLGAALAENFENKSGGKPPHSKAYLR